MNVTVSILNKNEYDKAGGSPVGLGTRYQGACIVSVPVLVIKYHDLDDILKR